VNQTSVHGTVTVNLHDDMALSPGSLIDYDHADNRHTPEGPRKAVRSIFQSRMPGSVLDVGCGTGTWLSALAELGVKDIFGIDGVDIPESALLFPIERFRKVDLTVPWALGRKFDVALCLEVAEHLDETSSALLIGCLAHHADTVVFSAACPGQPGQHHVNCRWPGYWQALFNDQGFTCSDAVRWQMWSDPGIDVWYRQNMFIATRNGVEAGKEPRLRAVIHPEFLDAFVAEGASVAVSQSIANAEQGAFRFSWYVTTLLTAFQSKLRDRLRGSGA
jgi:SAM-dependent methyltransferase